MADATTAQHFGGRSIKGLMLLQDTQLIETLAHFSRERIPERVVHARAVGAMGEFEVTHDISQYTSAAFLNGIGKKSPIMIRVSTVGPGRGSSDTIRDVRGWALKIKTEEGNQDFVFNDIVRYPIVKKTRKLARLIIFPNSPSSLSVIRSSFRLSTDPTSRIRPPMQATRLW